LQFGWKFEFSPKAKFRWKKKIKKEEEKKTHCSQVCKKLLKKKKNKNVDAGCPLLI